MNKLKARLLCAALAGAAGSVPAHAQSDINTLPQWDNTGLGITDWGPTVTQTYGQSFTATGASGALNSFTFYTRVSVGAPALQYQAYVYEWNAGTRRITGPALFTSAVNTMHSNAAYTAITIDTGGIRLVAGRQYVFFVTLAGVTTVPQAGGAYAFGSVPNATYPGGVFVYQNNGLNFSLLSTQAWLILGGATPDMAMLMRMGPTLTYAMTVAGNSPGLQAAGALDAMLSNSTANPGSDAAIVASAFSSQPTLAALSNAVNQTLPLFSAGMNSITLGAMRDVNRVVQARVDGETGISAGDAFQGDRTGWMKPYGSLAQQGAQGNAAGYDARSTGIAFGADRRLSSTTRVGIAAALGQVQVNSRESAANNNASIATYTLIGYGNHRFSERLDVSWQADLGLTDNKGRRVIDFGGLNRVATSNYKAYTAHAGVALTRVYGAGAGTTFAPALRADYSFIHANSYQEDGAGVLNLNANSAQAQELVIGADARFARKMGGGNIFTASLGVGVDVLNRRNTATASYVGGGYAFQTEGMRPSPWLLRGGVGVNLNQIKRAQVALRYDFEVRENYTNQTASVNVRMPF